MGTEGAAGRHVEYRRRVEVELDDEEQCAYFNQGRNGLKEASQKLEQCSEWLIEACVQMEDRKVVGKRVSHAAGTIGGCSDNSLWEMQAAEHGTGGRLTASLLGSCS